ncbi:MAG: hypothetical protein LBB42_00780 [Coriobacteriales bacterium]|jgi:hypothetical protein|nr:hypothetical protein [Coriobacteriales bacterium]
MTAKRLSLLGCILLLALALFGCTSANQTSTEQANNFAEENNPFATDEDGFVTETSVSYGPLVRSLSFDGSTVNVVYEFDNFGPPFEFGLLVFIDGVLQPYHSDQNEQAMNFQTFNLEKDEHAEIQLNFDPVVGAKGQTLSLRTMFVVRPHWQPDLTKPIIFGHTLECGGENYIPIEFLADSGMLKPNSGRNTVAVDSCVRIEDISEEMKDFYEENGLDFDEPRLTLEGLPTTAQSAVVGNSCQLTIAGVGGLEHNYRLYFFCDLEPHVFENGLPYVDFPIVDGKATYVDVDLTLSSENGRNTAAVFGLAVPTVDEPDSYAIRNLQTDRFLFIVE